MGSRLAISAAVTLATTTVAVGPSGAIAQEPADEHASSVFERGLEAYEQQDYEAAIEAFQRAYELDDSVETLYAWAQSERLSGDCDEAVRLYRKILSESPRFKHATVVQENLTLCEERMQEGESDASAPDEDRDHALPPVAPAADDTSGGVDALAVTLIAGGALSLGAATGLYVASNASRDGAAGAHTYDEYEDLRDRADLQRGIAFGTTAAGAVLIGIGILWAALSGPESETAVSEGSPGAEAAPAAQVRALVHRDGAMGLLETRW